MQARVRLPPHLMYSHMQASVCERDWVLLGDQRQKLTLFPPTTADAGGVAGVAGVDGAGGAGGRVGGRVAGVLRWRLLPLREGHVPLPLLAAWSTCDSSGSSKAWCVPPTSPRANGPSPVLGAPLPPPAFVGSVSVHVLPRWGV